MILAALAWLPLLGSGMSGEFLLRSAAITVVLIIGPELNGNTGCYAAIEPATAKVYTYHQDTGDWIGDGKYYRIQAERLPDTGLFHRHHGQSWRRA